MVKLPAPTPTKTFADPKVCKRVLAPDLMMPALAVVPGRFKLPARVMLPAEKFPLPSRLTMVLTVFALVAALAAFAPDATFAAVTPPTVLTTVALCGPVTSPESDAVMGVHFNAIPSQIKVWPALGGNEDTG